MIDLKSWVELRRHHDIDKCDARESAAWRRVMEELERRQKAERSRGFWQHAAISAWIVISVQVIGWWMGW